MQVTNVNKKLKEDTFVVLTILQIEKDFKLLGIEFIVRSYEINDLEEAICNTLLAISFEKLMQIAYTVDIEETKIKRWQHNGAHPLEFAKMIIERAALKVFLRLENTKNSL